MFLQADAVLVGEDGKQFRVHSLMMMSELFFCSKRKLNKNKQTKILVDMHFVVKSNFSSLDPVSSKS